MNKNIITLAFVLISSIYCAVSYIAGGHFSDNTVYETRAKNTKLNRFFCESAYKCYLFLNNSENISKDNLFSHIKADRNEITDLINNGSKDKEELRGVISKIDSLISNIDRFDSVNGKVSNLFVEKTELINKISREKEIIATTLDKKRAESYLNTKEVNSAYSNIAVSTEKISSVFYEAEVVFSKYIDSDDYQQFNSKLDSIKRKLNLEKRNISISSGSLNDEQLKNFSSVINSSFDDYLRITDQLKNLYIEKKKIRKAVYEVSYDILLNNSIKPEFEVIKKDVSGSYFSYIFLICLVVPFLTGIIFFFIIRSARKSVYIKNDLSESSFSLKDHVSYHEDDELKDVYADFNTFIDNIKEKVEEIAEDAEMLEISSEDIKKGKEDLYESEEQEKGIATIKEANEVIKDKFEKIIEKVTGAQTNINTVAVASEQMNSTIDEIAGNSANALNISTTAVDQASSASVKVADLGKAANEIGKVTEVISEISEQTNLLALNATIEAARAGDAGRGFAVVANEIKALARQTAEATLEIKEQIAGIQGVTDETVREITQITKTINDVNDIVEGIASAVKEQAHTSGELVNSITNANEGFSKINDDINDGSAKTSEIEKSLEKENIEKPGIKDSFKYKDKIEDMDLLSKQIKLRLNKLLGKE